MSQPDADNEILPKRFLTLLQGIGTTAAVLVALLALFGLSDTTAKMLAGVGSILLALVSVAIDGYRRRRAARLSIVENAEPLTPSAALHGLLPFEEGDQLPGRARDVQDLYTLIVSRTFRFSVLWGESGSGKTSLLRAGLVPMLKRQGYLPLYISRPSKNPQAAIRSELGKTSREAVQPSHQDADLVTLLRQAAPTDKSVVVIFDQFEEFFLTNSTNRARASFLSWLGQCIADPSVPVTFLVSIRADFFAQLQNLARHIPEPTSTRTTYQLNNFDTEQARQILNAAARIDAVPFEPSLINTVVDDLENDGFVRPAELQIVGTRLKRRNIFNLAKYEIAGRAKGILSSYINDEIKQSVDPQAMRLVLRLMCSEDGLTKAPDDWSREDILLSAGDEQEHGMSGQPRSVTIPTILKQLVAARILIHTDDDKYNLVHDYLAQYVREATKETETHRERANRLLRRSLAEYRDDPRTRIPYRQVRIIQRFAAADLKHGQRARELLHKSVWMFYTRLGTSAVLLFIPVLALYVFLATSYYLSIEPPRDVAGSPRIVVRTGHPAWKFVPGFDDVWVETDFLENRLAPESLYEVSREQVTGLRFRLTDEGYERWSEEIVQRLSPPIRVQALRWLAQPARARDVAIQIITDSNADVDMRSSVARMLGESGQANAQVIAPEAVQAMLPVIADLNADFNVRVSVIYALGRWGQVNPQLVTPEVMQALLSILADPNANVIVRGNIADVLGEWGPVNPQVITPEIMRAMLVILTESNVEYNMRTNIANALKNLGQANPQAVTPEVMQDMLAVLTDPNVISDIRFRVAYSLGGLGQGNPQVVTPKVLHVLLPIVTDPNVDILVRSYSAEALGNLGQANPQVVTPEAVQALLPIVTDPNADPGVRGDVTEALGKWVQANPQAVTPEIMHVLLPIVTDPDVSFDVRFSAAYTLGEWGQASSQMVTPEVLHVVVAALVDLNPASSARLPAADVLGRWGQANPQVITPEIMRALLAITIDPNIDTRVRLPAASALGRLGQANPQVVTPETVQALLPIVTDPNLDYSARRAVAEALGSLGQANPQVVTPKVMHTLLLSVIDPSVNTWVRSNAASALGSLGQANPQVVTPEVMHALLLVVTDSLADPDIRSAVAEALGSLGQANPQVVTPEIVEAMMSIITDPNADPSVRSSVAQVVGNLGYTQPQAISSEMQATLMSLLETSNDRVGTNAAAYPVSLLVVGGSQQAQSLTTQLETLQSGPQADRRIAASKTMEMIYIVRLIQEARDHPEERVRIRSLLEMLRYGQEAHLNFSVQFALEEMDKIEGKPGK